MPYPRFCSPCSLRFQALWLLMILGTSPASGQTPAQDGQWSAPFGLPLVAIHAAMLPTGKVLLFSAEHGVPGIHGWLLDPTSLALSNVPPPAGWNPDCSGHSFLADGRLLVAGGTLEFNPVLGSRQAFWFDPFAEQWVETGSLARGRWYPTNLTLPDGRVMTLSGLDDATGARNPDLEVWDPDGDGSWQLAAQKTVPFYPYLHLLPGGLVFRSGPDASTEMLDPASFTWTPVADTLATSRYEAPSVLLPPTSERVMLVGGSPGSGPPTNTAEIIDLSDAVPQWMPTEHMASPRWEHAAVVLPDGTVLVVGGRSNGSGPDVPVLVPEVFDPVAETWDAVAPHQIARMYHSSALLLPDARVLVAGGDFEPSGEIFSPPYLFQGPRPSIQAAPTELIYGMSFDLSFTSAAGANEAVLIRLSSSTHSLNMGQRYVTLASLGAGGGTEAVPAPADPSQAPPGYYMLFVVNDAGVPSESRIVQVPEPVAAFGLAWGTALLSWLYFASRASKRRRHFGRAPS